MKHQPAFDIWVSFAVILRDVKSLPIMWYSKTSTCFPQLLALVKMETRLRRHHGRPLGAPRETSGTHL